MSPQGLGREVVAEVSPDHPTVSVSPGDFTPHDPLGDTLLGGSAVDVGDTLAEVVTSSFLVLDTVELEEGGVGVLGALAPLEPDVGGLGVEADDVPLGGALLDGLGLFDGRHG